MPKTATTLHPQTITKPTGESFTFNMVAVEGGTFIFGLTENPNYEKLTYEIKLDTFLASQYPVTQDFYEFVTGKNPSHFLGKRRPVERVDWFEAIEFCNKLSLLKGLKACYQINNSDKVKTEFLKNNNGYRLPTETEWECAARGGNPQKSLAIFADQNELFEVGWFHENSFKETMPVGLIKSNELGIHDFYGNIEEWTNRYLIQNQTRVHANSIGCSWKWWIKRDGMPKMAYKSTVGYNLAHTKQDNIGFRIFKSLH